MVLKWIELRPNDFSNYENTPEHCIRIENKIKQKFTGKMGMVSRVYWILSSSFS